MSSYLSLSVDNSMPSAFLFCLLFKFQKGLITYRGTRVQSFSEDRFLHSCQDTAQLLSLPLGLDVCSHSLLGDLEGALVFGDLEQLHGWLF